MVTNDHIRVTIDVKAETGALMHRLKMDAIKWQMRLDVTRILEAFAERVIR